MLREVNGFKFYLNFFDTYFTLIDQTNPKRRCKFLKSKYLYIPLVDLVNDFNKSMEYLQ